MINRLIHSQIKKHLFKGKAIILLGPRQSGKTTLLEAMLKECGEKFLSVSGDEPDIREQFSNITSTRLKSLIGNSRILFIDEAQQIENIGLTLKLLTDRIKEVQVIASGSSAFELSDRIQEPLTGRKYEFFLYPVSFQEMVQHHGLLEEERLLEHRLVFGYYPEIITKSGEEEKHLRLLAGSYLYKDLFKLEQIKKPVLLEKILKAFALQVGSEVSFLEIGQLVSADSATVEKYTDLLEKAYIIFRLPALSRNVRSEIKKGKKIYFYDNGIRNAVIGNYNLLSNRTDKGALWENFLISERIKWLRYNNVYVSSYFWRTVQQQEIDYIEEKEGEFFAKEFKWSAKRGGAFSHTFTGNYNVRETQVIARENFSKFLLS